MTDLSARIADLQQREAEERTERARLIRAVNKAITLILTVAAVGVLTVISIAPTERKLATDARINQEQITWQK
ncbi:hypothetical protein [Rhizobium phaseoli]|uniref:hypothetical protein n=1 Tax=Rhizobium phaseoli TaxID=396 RepID=UPI0002DEBFC9|nr:hypothetical protein [Rhizobium phaseoli]KKZ89026.1 hypothetical protein RPHASCH2410_CH00085 [Rhizobium phaseoli Ch24-10]